MQCSTMCQIANLMPARRTGCNDRRIRLGGERGQQRQVGNLHTEFIMLLLEPERPCHPAAARIEQGYIQFWYQAQRRRRAVHTNKRLLMAVAMQDASLGSRS